MLEVGDRVYKPKGYPFPGTVVARFTTIDGALRFVVECITLPGLLHIYSLDQLELLKAKEPT